MSFLAKIFKRSTLRNPEPWLIEAFGGRPSATGVSVNEESALRATAVYACNNILSQSVASLPLNVYERLERGKRRATEHALHHVLHSEPNSEMSSYTWRTVSQLHLGTWGNSYSQKVFNRAGQVVELWPLRPDKTKPRREGGKLFYEILLPSGETRFLPPEEVLHIKGLGGDGLVGYSPVRLMREAIGMSLATEEYGARFFGNGAKPGGVLEHPGSLSEPAQNNLRKSWNEMHQGLDKQHRIAILEEGMTYKQIGIPPEDAQFLDTRKFQLLEIARIYRIPPHMLADLERATFSNIEHQSIDFVVHTIRPWLVNWEQEILRSLFVPTERQRYFAEFVIEGLLRGDAAARADFYNRMFSIGVYSQNDIREKENDNPFDGGDDHYVPLNMVPISIIKDVEHKQRSIKESRGKQAARGRFLLGRNFEPLFADATKRIVKREEVNVMQLAKSLLQRDTGAFLDKLERWYDNHEDYIKNAMTPIITSYVDAINQAASQEVNGEPIDASDFTREYVDKYVARHRLSSEGQLRAVVRTATDEGRDPIDDLQQRFDEWVERRPDKVASEETIKASNAVAKLVFAYYGFTKLRWVAQGDEPCPYCQNMDGKVVGMQQNFLDAETPYQPNGADMPLTSRGPIGHPPLHQGCVCQIVPER